MRLWHQLLIPYLPRQQLLGQHRECCALRGKGWGRKHATVDYVFDHPMEKLILYHFLVMREMERRRYRVDQKWYNPSYRGKSLPVCNTCGITIEYGKGSHTEEKIYPEHNTDYLLSCLNNLCNKGVLGEVISRVSEEAVDLLQIFQRKL